MNRSQIILLIINLALVLGFGGVFLTRGNTEFVIYIGVIIFFMAIIGVTLKAARYTTATLVGLTVWSAMHLAGGGITVGEGRLYDVMLIQLTESIFRYDQLVHIWGFGAATLVMYCLMPDPFKSRLRGSVGLNIVLVMAGLGVGALNEIVEFLVSLALPENGVGGYVNTSLDLCADLIGAVLALGYIHLRYLHGGHAESSGP